MVDVENMRLSLKSHIENSGFELSKIAEAMGVSMKTLKNYISGKTLPRIAQIVKLCLFLNVSAQSLLGLTNEIKKHDQ